MGPVEWLGGTLIVAACLVEVLASPKKTGARLSRFAHRSNHPRDIVGVRVGRDAMAQVENMRPAAKCRDDAFDLLVHLEAPSDQQAGIEIAFEHKLLPARYRRPNPCATDESKAMQSAPLAVANPQ